MTEQASVLCFAGSLRTDSLNKKLVKIAMTGAQEAGARVTFVDLNELPMPIYNGDDETKSGLPENAKKLKKLMKEHDAFLIASPEYNSSISGALKNAIDWASRPEEGEKPLECFKGKIAGLMACSPGALGGLRGLVHLRAILGNIGVIVVTEQTAVPSAMKAFDEKGDLSDEKMNASVKAIGARVVTVASALKNAK
jgi:chromate reductase, NAD(P)H dehydrogenase (quinone)